MILVKVQNLSKSYKEYNNEWFKILNIIGFKFKAKNEKFILKNISLELNKGESLGILG